MILELNSQTIEINEYSIIHILNRHFAAISQRYDSQKTFHNEDFEPDILNIQLKNIIKTIDNTNLLVGYSLDKLAFQFKGIDYDIWTSIKKKYIKGKEISFRRLNTFYPVLDVEEKKELELNYSLIKINEELAVYLIK